MNNGFITYFGYGSLVNRETRPANEHAVAARLYGWQRIWGHRVLSAQQPANEPARSCCSLSVQKLSNAHSEAIKSRSYIDGVVVTIPISELAALDAREAGYDRLALPCAHFDLPESCRTEEVHVYVSKETHQGNATEQFPILQSYVDCVLAGYCAVFEQHGMQQFVDSTVGWDGVIENERDNPKYPRAVSVQPEQLAMFDQVVAKQRMSAQQESH